MEFDRTEEDKIIEILSIEGKDSLFDDSDFIPSRQSLYENGGVVPPYDLEVVNSIVWRRPTDVHPNPEYFSESYGLPLVTQGTLADDTFIGVLCGICSVNNGDYIENIIFSRPGDFKRYGVFTCRFYVDGQWIEVITDTRLPCIWDDAKECAIPVYSRAVLRKEMWTSLIEKAYAKALGSYEAITKVKIPEALLHLTGGSVQEIQMNDENCGDSNLLQSFSKKLKGFLSQKMIVLALPTDRNSNAAAKEGEDGRNVQDDELEGSEGILVNHLYAVIMVKEVGNHELVMLRCPWAQLVAENSILGDGTKEFYKNGWDGDWSETSSKWDEYVDVLHAVEDDPNISWRRTRPNGYMWVAFRQFVKLFKSLFCTKIFSPEQTSFYCVKGEWRDKTAGGPMTSIRDRDEGTKLAGKSEIRALANATAHIVIDGDTSWFNNPQFKLKCSTPTTVYLSVTLSAGHDFDKNDGSSNAQPFLSLYVVTHSKYLQQHHYNIGDSCMCDIVATDKDGGVTKAKGQEASIWNLKLQPDVEYFVVPFTHRKGIKCGFVFRIFATNPIEVEQVALRVVQSFNGEWTKTTSIDTTGGPVTILNESTKKHQVNSKWCQNPQYHLGIIDSFGTSDIYVKIVLRRTDKTSGHRATNLNDRPEPNVGLVICKPDVDELEKRNNKSKKLGQPRLNPFGEVICSKPSSLRKPTAVSKLRSLVSKSQVEPGEKKIKRKVALDKLYFSQQTTFTNRHEACIYLPKIPRAWIPDGLIIVPCLSEKNVRGTFELEVYSSGNVTLQHLPDTITRSIGGEWVEGLAGGSHLCPSFKKNPKFFLDLIISTTERSSLVDEAIDTACPVRISISKCGASWKNQCKMDAVGCMIGFYVFIVSRNESGVIEHSRQIHETVFAPTEEVSTDAGFTLEYLPHGNSYMIVPTTFYEGKLGGFVLSVTASCDYNLYKEA